MTIFDHLRRSEWDFMSGLSKHQFTRIQNTTEEKINTKLREYDVN